MFQYIYYSYQIFVYVYVDRIKYIFIEKKTCHMAQYTSKSRVVGSTGLIFARARCAVFFKRDLTGRLTSLSPLWSSRASSAIFEAGWKTHIFALLLTWKHIIYIHADIYIMCETVIVTKRYQFCYILFDSLRIRLICACNIYKLYICVCSMKQLQLPNNTNTIIYL